MNRVHGIIVACAAVLLTTAWATPAASFGLSGVGLRVGSVDPEGVDGTLAGGGHLEFEEAGSRFHITPNVLFWSEDGLSDLNPNLDVYYHFSPAGRVSPYVGAGAAVHVYSMDGPADPGTDLGMNLFGGVSFPSGNTRFFAEVRHSATDLSQTSIFGGVTLPFSH